MTSSNLFGSNSGNSANSNYQRMALDNLLRRELRISDPNDPQQVAQALLSRYKDDPRANAITQEARGLPFLQAAATAVPVALTPSSSDAELKQAVDDVNRDLEALLQNSLLKDITPELQGWAQAIRSAMQEGTVAARFALDPRQRDKAFAIRRQLGDYARVARFVGALTPTLNLVYRKFAQSLDEVASILLVLMGEALANVGFSGGRFLLQTPYSELQVRRDAVINALRNLAGSTQTAFGPNEWPRGLDAYRSLFRLLEVNGQGDLRSLLVENELSRVMDELIQRAAHGNADGLRALGATAKLDLQRFRRLIILGQRSVSPESPPLVAFLEALQLFVDAFDIGGGFRLLKVARPPILFYGLYGMGSLDNADQALIKIVMARADLADKLDCLLVNNPSLLIQQVLLDKILYDIDRSIDLYAVGVDECGEPERRAAAYSFLIAEFIKLWADSLSVKIKSLLENLVGVLRPLIHNSNEELESWNSFNVTLNGIIAQISANLTDEEKTLFSAELNRKNTIGTLEDFENSYPSNTNVKALNIISIATALYDKYQVMRSYYPNDGRIVKNGKIIFLNSLPLLPEKLDITINVMQQELCIQQETERRWENLVKTMSTNCSELNVFDKLQELIQKAVSQVSDNECVSFVLNLPPHPDTSLDSIANDVDRMGLNRPGMRTLGRNI